MTPEALGFGFPCRVLNSRVSQGEYLYRVLLMTYSTATDTVDFDVGDEYPNDFGISYHDDF